VRSTLRACATAVSAVVLQFALLTEQWHMALAPKSPWLTGMRTLVVQCCRSGRASLPARGWQLSGSRRRKDTMTAKEFMKAVANGEDGIIQVLLDILAKTNTPYCVIGGLAVNAYMEPVVSLDLDIVVIAGQVEQICARAAEQGLQVECFPRSINLSSTRSEVRVQIHTDSQYQAFITRTSNKRVLGYDIQVARLEDVLQGKLWAYQDDSRRKSKRQKDLADIMRIIEAHPSLASLLTDSVRQLIE